MKAEVCQREPWAGVGSMQGSAFIVRLAAVTTGTGIYIPPMAVYRCTELLRNCEPKANPCRQGRESVSEQNKLNVGSGLCPSVPGEGENKHHQVILTTAASFKSCMSSHNSFISCMSFEKQSQLLKGCKLIKKILLKIYPLVEGIEIFLPKMCSLVSGGDLQNKILIDWTPFQFCGECKMS